MDSWCGHLLHMDFTLETLAYHNISTTSKVSDFHTYGHWNIHDTWITLFPFLQDRVSDYLLQDIATEGQ